MTLVVFGLDALDPDLVDPEEHPNLVLSAHQPIETITSRTGEPSTHELWPTIITGMRPEEHGIILGEGGVGWSNPVLRLASSVADVAIPDRLQSKFGAWLLNNTDRDVFRTPASYYAKNGLTTVFDGVKARAIGVPNYVVDPSERDREHQLRQRLGDFMTFNPDADHSHQTDDRFEFYELCLEMVMIRIARIRRALRGGRYELIFGYTSGLDLLGHVAHNDRKAQERAYDEIDDFVGELVSDLNSEDVLLLVSDHGLKEGFHTEPAMAAATATSLINGVDSVLDIRATIEAELMTGAHEPGDPETLELSEDVDAVRDHLEDLGYM